MLPQVGVQITLQEDYDAGAISRTKSVNLMKLMKGDISDVLRVARSRIQVMFLQRGASASEAVLGVNILPSKKPKNPSPLALANLLQARAPYDRKELYF